MFKRLSGQIILITLLSVWICTAVLGIFSYKWAEKTLISQFIDLTSSYFNSSSDRLDQYLNYTEQTSIMILGNPTLSQAMLAPTMTSGITQLLDNQVLYLNSEIDGVAMYRRDGIIYTLSRISNAPTLSQLSEDPLVHKFLADPVQKHAWISRHKGESSYYNNSYGRNGIFSFFQQIIDEVGKPAGTMVVDIDSDKLFHFYQTKNAMFTNSSLFMIHDGSKLVRSPDSPNGYLFADADFHRINNGAKGWFKSSDGGDLILYTAVKQSNATMVMLVPLGNAAAHLSSLSWLFLGFAVMFGAVSIAITVILKNSIIHPLIDLFGKMKAVK